LFTSISKDPGSAALKSDRALDRLAIEVFGGKCENIAELKEGRPFLDLAFL
jgi:hypothetical protein